ncbi:MAG: hypothetical protein JW974_01775 [Alphaproteobacteria bacterium]|nr:hypothetical protein [Alphaproteobacteria bacterium]MBN2675510.1 hypothetical protein [Alphaproteobacteria bacterium]
MKKVIYILCAISIIGWVGFRFTVIGSENARYIFNPSRVFEEQGVPVKVMQVNRKTDVLKEPLSVKNNRALVSSSRVYKFRVGQKVGTGSILSVSNNIDLDSGMHVITTRGASDGLNYAELKNNGFFVPIYAINNNSLMIVKDGFAQKIDVGIVNQDSDNAVISKGLSDGDIIILSKIGEGERVKMQN